MAKALRKCRVCGIEAIKEKDLVLFRTNNQLKHNKDNLCKACHSEQRREDHLQRAYGLSMSDYEDLLNNQNNSCAVCLSSFSGHSSKHMCVDHNHSTGEVRGLLCHSCNTGIGKFKDSPEILTMAIAYLQEKGYYG